MKTPEPVRCVHRDCRDTTVGFLTILGNCLNLLDAGVRLVGVSGVTFRNVGSLLREMGPESDQTGVKTTGRLSTTDDPLPYSLGVFVSQPRDN